MLLPEVRPGDAALLLALRVIKNGSAASDARDEAVLGAIERVIAEADGFLASGPDMPGRVQEVRFCRQQLAEKLESGDMRVTSDIWMYGMRIYRAIVETRHHERQIADTLDARDAERRAKGSKAAKANRDREPVDPELVWQIRTVIAQWDTSIKPTYKALTEEVNRRRRSAGQPEVPAYTMRRICIRLGTLGSGPIN
jgi:hypothetical protein